MSLVTSHNADYRCDHQFYQFFVSGLHSTTLVHYHFEESLYTGYTAILYTLVALLPRYGAKPIEEGSVSWITRIDAINNPYGWKVVSLLFVSIWIYAVIAIEETFLHNLVPHDTPRSMISFSQVSPNSSLHSHLIIFLTTRIGLSYCHNRDPYRVYLSRRNGLVAT